MENKAIRTETEIAAHIRKVNGAMTLEGMPLTADIKKNLRKCLTGESTTEKEIQKVIDKYKRIYG